MNRTVLPFPFGSLGRVALSSRGHRSRTYICAHSSLFDTHNGYPLCYEMPCSSLSKGRLSGKLRCNVMSDERGKPRVISCLAATLRLRFLRSLTLGRNDKVVKLLASVVRSEATLIAIVRFIRQSAAANIKYLLSHTIHAAEFRHYVPHARQ